MESDTSKKPSVYVTVPNPDGWVHKGVALVLLRLLPDPRVRVRIEMPTHVPFENNLHHIVESFMQSSGEDFWLSIDADNPPSNNPLDLVELDLDIVGLPTPVWHYTGQPGERPIYWNAYDYAGPGGYREHEPKEGLQRVDAVGSGCFLIARRVFEDPAMRMAPFERELESDGRVRTGPDIAFCERARSRGLEIYTHYDYPCEHFVQLPLTEVIKAHQRVHG